MQEVTLDGWVLVFTLGLALVTNFLFGLWPARLSANADIQLALKSGAHGSSDSLGARRTRNWLVVGEIALTLVLLISAALVLKSFARAQSLSLGFEPRGLVTANLDLPFRVYTTHDKIADFSERILEKVRALPGVTDAALNSSPPLSSRWQTGYLREGAARADARPATFRRHRNSDGRHIFRPCVLRSCEGASLTNAIRPRLRR